MNKKFPQIRIEFAWLLDPTFREAYELSKKSKALYPSIKEIEKKAVVFLKIWKKSERKILRAMCNILGLRFYQNTIDVHIVGRGRTFSYPMVISSHYKPLRFVDILTHEILHRLLTDNTRRFDPSKILKKMFPKESLLTRNHVFVHAVHKYIFLDVLKVPQRFKEEVSKLQSYPDYKRAWEIVEEKGYKNLIAELKKYYSR